jgi:hypothetical protein
LGALGTISHARLIRQQPRPALEESMETVLIIVLIFFLLGGGFYGYRRWR